MTDSLGYANRYRKQRDMILFVLRQLPLFDVYKDFPEHAGIPQIQFGIVDDRTSPACDLVRNLINEEVNCELIPAIEQYKRNPTLENLVGVVDGGIDAIYVVLQLFHMLDLPFNKAFAEVHAANMAKLQRGDDNQILKRADGKILQPEGWKPPEIFEVLLEHSNLRAAQRANADSPEEAQRRGQEMIESARQAWGG